MISNDTLRRSTRGHCTRWCMEELTTGGYRKKKNSILAIVCMYVMHVWIGIRACIGYSRSWVGEANTCL